MNPLIQREPDLQFYFDLFFGNVSLIALCSSPPGRWGVARLSRRRSRRSASLRRGGSATRWWRTPSNHQAARATITRKATPTATKYPTDAQLCRRRMPKPNKASTPIAANRDHFACELTALSADLRSFFNAVDPDSRKPHGSCAATSITVRSTTTSNGCKSTEHEPNGRRLEALRPRLARVCR